MALGSSMECHPMAGLASPAALGLSRKPRDDNNLHEGCSKNVRLKDTDRKHCASYATVIESHQKAQEVAKQSK